MIELPRRVQEQAPAISEWLDGVQHPLYEGSSLTVPMIPFTKEVIRVLRAGRMRRRVFPGLEEAEQLLEHHGCGQKALQKRGIRTQPRISRLLLLTNDAALRLCRRVERLSVEYATLLLVCRLDCSGDQVGQVLFGSDSTVKVVLVSHKDDAADFLLACYSTANPHSHQS